VHKGNWRKRSTENNNNRGFACIFQRFKSISRKICKPSKRKSFYIRMSYSTEWVFSYQFFFIVIVIIVSIFQYRSVIEYVHFFFFFFWKV